MYLKNCNTCKNNGKLMNGCNGNCVELNGENTWSDWKPKKGYQDATMILSAFPACGKSTSYRNQESVSVLDSDSSEFSWVKDENGKNTKERNPNFPQNYISHIKSQIGIVDIIMVSSHEAVRKALHDNNLKFSLVYPKIEFKNEWIRRFEERGNDENFIKFISDNWEKFIEELENEKCEIKFRLNENGVINSENLQGYFDGEMGNLSYMWLQSNIWSNKYKGD